MLSYATLVVLAGLLSPALSLDLNAFLEKKVYGKCMDMICSDLESFTKKEEFCLAKLSGKDQQYMEENLLKKCYEKSSGETLLDIMTKVCKDNGKYFECHSKFLIDFMAVERNTEEQSKLDATLECLAPVYNQCI